jgi:hypothetical protein
VFTASADHRFGDDFASLLCLTTIAKLEAQP